MCVDNTCDRLPGLCILSYPPQAESHCLYMAQLAQLAGVVTASHSGSKVGTKLQIVFACARVSDREAERQAHK